MVKGDIAINIVCNNDQEGALVASHVGNALQSEGYGYDLYVGDEMIQRHPGREIRKMYQVQGSKDLKPKVVITVTEV